MSVELVELSPDLPAVDGVPSQAAIERLEAHLLDLPQVYLRTREYRVAGLLAREITIPAGVALTGDVHLCDHICTLHTGTIRVTTDEGVQELTGPVTIECKAGSKRAGFAVTECLWTTYMPIDPQLTSKAEVEAALFANPHKLGTNRLKAIGDARDDYVRFLDEYRLSDAAIQVVMAADKVHEIPMPEGFDAAELRPSAIHGLGLFAVRDLTAGEVVAPARWRGKKAPAGRYTNHSNVPNGAFINQGPDMLLVARHEIKAGTEITIDYRQSMEANGVPRPEGATA